VVALVPGLAGGASLPPLVAVGQPGEPWQHHHLFQELQDVCRRAVLAGQQADVQVAPGHQPREVAADHQHRADVGEQLVEVELREDLGGLGLQGHLPGEQLLVAGRGRHSSGEVLAEPGEDLGVGLGGGGLVVAGAGVVEEGVVGARVGDDLVGQPCALGEPEKSAPSGRGP
jgi:hypothetical protein